MHVRKLGLVLMVVLMLALAGCSASQMAWPDREVSVDLDTALAAQDMGMAAMLTGSVTWTESDFSSFLTYLMRQNTGANFPVDTVQTWFEADNQIFIRVTLKDDVLKGFNTLDLAGKIMVQDKAVQVAISEAAAGGVAVGGPILDMIGAQINKALSDPSMGVLVDVATDSGSITLSLGGM